MTKGDMINYQKDTFLSFPGWELTQNILPFFIFFSHFTAKLSFNCQGQLQPNPFRQLVVWLIFSGLHVQVDFMVGHSTG
jgi:hypothetical protein